MGIEPFLVGSALDCVLAQRLARRLCAKCKEPYEPPAEDLERARFPWSPDEGPPPVLYRRVGCSACAKTGYKGRLALHEVMTVTEEVERLAVDRASGTEIGRVARSQGMTMLRDDGMAKVRAGLTSIEEILRVVA
jgi:type IV pilus assembly protein PilB